MKGVGLREKKLEKVESRNSSLSTEERLFNILQWKNNVEVESTQFKRLQVEAGKSLGLLRQAACKTSFSLFQARQYTF